MMQGILSMPMRSPLRPDAEARASAGRVSVGVVCQAARPEVQADAKATAAESGLEYRENASSEFEFLLVRDDERWALRDPNEPRMQPLAVDLAQLARKLVGNIGKRQPFARAIGAKTKTVIDATAGLGRDAFLLALLGYEVIAIERSPVIAVLLRDGLRRALAEPGIEPAARRIRLVIGDAREALARLPRADAVYIDPMFPPKRKASAVARKEMLWLRKVAGADADAQEMFETALRYARERVVVKRPDDAEPLAGEPTMSYGGKLVRYDVYRIGARGV